MRPYKVDKAMPFKFYVCICSGPPRLTWSGGCYSLLHFFTFLHLLNNNNNNNALQNNNSEGLPVTYTGSLTYIKK